MPFKVKRGPFYPRLPLSSYNTELSSQGNGGGVGDIVSRVGAQGGDHERSLSLTEQAVCGVQPDRKTVRAKGHKGFEPRN